MSPAPVTLRGTPTWYALALLLIVGVGLMDYATGIEIGFFVFYFFPVALAAWAGGLPAAIMAGGLSAALWVAADLSAGSLYSAPGVVVWNTVIRLAAFVAIGWTTARIHALLDRERSLATELGAALDEVRTLKGLLPVCAWCSRIQDEAGSWLPLDSYIRSHTDAQVSHGLCDACAQAMLAQEGASL